MGRFFCLSTMQCSKSAAMAAGQCLSRTPPAEQKQRSGCPAGREQGKITQKTDPCLQLLQTGALLYQGYNQRFLPR